MIGLPKNSKTTAATYLVSRLFTDAVFNNDIRAIQLIIQRIDGGLPKDCEMAYYRTDFADCLDKVMSMTSAEQTKLHPDDSVMIALCKSLYDISVEDIYWDYENGRKKRPSSEVKKERDAALRMILERAGGRKTLTPVVRDEETEEIASWIKELPA